MEKKIMAKMAWHRKMKTANNGGGEMAYRKCRNVNNNETSNNEMAYHGIVAAA
jgi:hypothetical protein